MRAIQVTHHGGPEVLNYGTVDDPIPAPDEVIARTSAIGVNFIDTYLRRGMYPSTPPYVPGTEGAGEIVAVGTPEEVANNERSWTGKYLKEVLDRHEQRRVARQDRHVALGARQHHGLDRARIEDALGRHEFELHRRHRFTRSVHAGPGRHGG